MTDDLRECPFCGGEAIKTETKYYLGFGCNNPTCEVLPSTRNITAWNTRALAPIIRELLADMEKMREIMQWQLGLMEAHEYKNSVNKLQQALALAEKWRNHAE